MAEFKLELSNENQHRFFFSKIQPEMLTTAQITAVVIV